MLRPTSEAMVVKPGDGTLRLVPRAGKPEVEQWPRVKEPADARKAEKEPDRKCTELCRFSSTPLRQPNERDQRQDNGRHRPRSQYELPYRPPWRNVCRRVS